MSQALYRKYRSRKLTEVLGQDHVTTILSRALKKGRVSHAYLLSGPRGTGKTSVARILAHEINELPYDGSTHLDIIEIDAASNNGVDDIRQLREKSQVAPVSAKRKVYIIDEVHMLSKPAFNALLKTLEEPPAHVVFILATTDADKLPSTILSRVQQYHFRPISTPVITKQLMNIAKQEGFLIEEEAARLIAERSRGGFRDSISLLDQLSSLASKDKPLTIGDVIDNLGLMNQESITQLLDMYSSGQSTEIIKLLQELDDQGGDPLTIAQQLLSEARKRIVKQPELLDLIQELIEVSRHPHPDLRLITALVGSMRPSASLVHKSTVAHSPQVAPTAPLPKPEPKKEAVKPQPEPKTEPADPVVSTEPSPETKSSKPAISQDAPKDFDWQKLLDEAKGRSMGIFSILQRCDYEYENGTLTLFAGTSFAQKKLDDVKNRPIIGEVIQKSQGGDINVITKSGKRPPKDSTVAAVAAMMGGGEEVNLEEIS